MLVRQSNLLENYNLSDTNIEGNRREKQSYPRISSNKRAGWRRLKQENLTVRLDALPPQESLASNEEDFDEDVHDLAEKAIADLHLPEWNGRPISPEDIEALIPLAQQICNMEQPSEDVELNRLSQLALLGSEKDSLAHTLLQRDIAELHVHGEMVCMGPTKGLATKLPNSGRSIKKRSLSGPL